MLPDLSDMFCFRYYTFFLPMSASTIIKNIPAKPNIGYKTSMSFPNDTYVAGMAAIPRIIPILRSGKRPVKKTQVLVSPEIAEMNIVIKSTA